MIQKKIKIKKFKKKTPKAFWMSKSRVDVLLTSVSEVEMSELRCVMDDKKKNYERIDMRPPQQSG